MEKLYKDIWECQFCGFSTRYPEQISIHQAKHYEEAKEMEAKLKEHFQNI